MANCISFWHGTWKKSSNAPITQSKWSLCLTISVVHNRVKKIMYLSLVFIVDIDLFNLTRNSFQLHNERLENFRIFNVTQFSIKNLILQSSDINMVKRRMLHRNVHKNICLFICLINPSRNVELLLLTPRNVFLVDYLKIALSRLITKIDPLPYWNVSIAK